MDIPALSMAMSQQNLMTDVNVAILGKSLDLVESTGVNIAKMLDQSVTPHLGQSIDISL